MLDQEPRRKIMYNLAKHFWGDIADDVVGGMLYLSSLINN